MTLSIDIETYSSNDLFDSGVYKYAEAKDFEILMLAYSIDDDVAGIIDLTETELPEWLVEMILDPTVKKKAWNAQFERVCLSKHLKRWLSANDWECTLTRAIMRGYPLALMAAGKAIGSPVLKQADGLQLIKYFTQPCKPTKVNGQRTRNMPYHDLEKWNKFLSYCKDDVNTEVQIGLKLGKFQIPANEKQLYSLDQKINDTGVLIDLPFVRNVMRIDEESRERLTTEAVELTGMPNPNSVSQIKEWIQSETDEIVGSLNKKVIDQMLKAMPPPNVEKMLKLRKQLGKSSLAKYEKMVSCACADLRARGVFQFYGASRTGRWAGRLIQLQNLTKNKLKDIDLARLLATWCDDEIMMLTFGNVPDTLSQLIRTSFIAPPGKKLLVSDFSAIEARIIAWLANEVWRLEVFRTHGKIYEASAAQMFGVPIETVTKTSDIRNKSKMAELALGYQGGVAALIRIGALDEGLTEDELPEIVRLWRDANPAICRLWREIEITAVGAVEGKLMRFRDIYFSMEGNSLKIKLPSGRCLYYVNARLVPNKFGGKSVAYEGINQNTKQWGFILTYGGKFVENIVQAIARDYLCEAMQKIDGMGYKIIMHVHDELVLEVDEKTADADLGTVTGIMSENISWADGLPMRAEGFVNSYYKKD